jgi:Matrixin
MRSKLISLGIALALVSCSSPQAPDRSISYDFADGFGEVFRWPRERTPVSYWTEDRGALATYVEAAIELWESQFLYREWSGLMVDDSSAADVIVLLSGGTPPPSPRTDDPPVRVCFGETVGTVVGNNLEGAIQTTLFWSPGSAASDVANCLARVTAHEIGHTLGLLSHSLDPNDLMFNNPAVRRPSQADRNTVQILYHTSPTLGPPVR